MFKGQQPANILAYAKYDVDNLRRLNSWEILGFLKNKLNSQKVNENPVAFPQ